MSKKLSRRRAYFFLLINLLCWGVVFPIVKPAFTYTTPYRFLLYRFSLASVLSLPFFFFYLVGGGGFPKIKHCLREIVVITAIEILGTTVALLLLYEGLARSTAIESGIIATSGPLFIVAAGTLFLHEREQKRQWVGIFIAFLATLFLTFVGFQNPSLRSLSFLGNILVLGYNIVDAVYFALAKRYYRRIPKFFAASVSFYVGAISFFALAWSEAHFSLSELITLAHQDSLHPSVWIASVYMAIFGSLIGLTAYIIGQDFLDISEASIFSYLQPLIYIPLSVFFLGESFTATHLIALVAIFLGVFIAEKRK